MTLNLNRQVLAVLSCFLPLAAHAQNPAGIPRLDEIVVTASRTAQLEKDVLGDVTVIDKKELERAGQSSLAEVLSRHHGIELANSGGPQTQTSVFLRGANQQHTLVLVDGIRINSSAQGGANWNAIDPAAIDRIEIVRGAASSLYGSDAIGGVVNIITKKTGEDRPLSAWANIGFGTYGTAKTSAGISGAQDGWDYHLTGSLADSSGFNATNEQSFSFHPDKDGYHETAWSGSLGYRWAPGHHIGLTAYNSLMNGDFDAGAFYDAPYTLTRQQAYGLTSTNDITANWQSVLRFGLSKETLENRSFDSRYSSLQRSYAWQNNLKLGDSQHVSLVLERLEERPTHSSAHTVSRRDTNAAGLIYRGDFGAQHLQANIRNDNITGYGNQVTGGLAYDFDLNDVWTVGVAGNTGFRAPSFADLYSPESFGFVGNPNLKPEKSRNIEASIRYEGDATRLALVVYQNKIRDLINGYVCPVGAFNCSPENIDRATIRGLTLSAEQDYGNTTLRASADFMNPRDDNTNNLLPRRARQTYRLGAEHRFNAVRVGAEYQFTGKRYDDVANTTRLAGYGLLNLTAGYDFSPRVGVQLRWNNVLDKNYHSVYGYNMPGSNVFVNLSLKM
jgi:vitamin B12 transporter